ncbi:hypothetical protein J6590_037210 [Homalodisca vitripennis]|nr:hypothetical protein J6590_037210 [Homalodisca vitripennis]
MLLRHPLYSVRESPGSRDNILGLTFHWLIGAQSTRAVKGSDSKLPLSTKKKREEKRRAY